MSPAHVARNYGTMLRGGANFSPDSQTPHVRGHASLQLCFLHFFSSLFCLPLKLLQSRSVVSLQSSISLVNVTLGQDLIRFNIID